MTPASQAIGALKAAGPTSATPKLTTIIHNLLEAGRMGDEPLGVKDLLRRR